MKKLALIVSLLIFISCDDDNGSNNDSAFETSTGIHSTDEAGNSLGQIGEANTDRGKFNCGIDDADTCYVISTIPNPTSSIFTIVIDNKQYFGDSTKIYIKPVLYSGPNSIEAYNDNMRDLGPDYEKIIHNGGLLQGEFTFTVSDLIKGYYRIYFESADAVFYDNLIVE